MFHLKHDVKIQIKNVTHTVTPRSNQPLDTSNLNPIFHFYLWIRI